MDSWTQQGRRMSGAGIPRIARAVAVAVVLSPVAAHVRSRRRRRRSAIPPTPTRSSRRAPTPRCASTVSSTNRFGASCKPSTNFVQKDPVEGAPPRSSRDVRMIITDDAVDHRRAAAATTIARVLSALGPPTDGAAGGYLDDYFEIQIDPHREHLTSFAFNVAPNGNRRAWIVGRDGTRDESWNFRWDVATRVDAKGWTRRGQDSALRVPRHSGHGELGGSVRALLVAASGDRRVPQSPNSLLRAASTQGR